MKNNLLLILFTAFLLSAFAQSSARISPDFTAITMDHDTVVLSDVLNNQNKMVALEFFFTESQICQETAPFTNEAYKKFGCNQHDVVFLSVNKGNDSVQCKKYMDSLNIKIPIVTGLEGNGNQIADDYGIFAYPTIILISPDTLIAHDTITITDTIISGTDTTYNYEIEIYPYNVYVQDLWPVTGSDTIVDLFVTFGIREFECGPAAIFDPEANLENAFELYPNPASNQVTISQLKQNELYTYDLIDISGKIILQGNFLSGNETEINLNISSLKRGIYLIRVMSNTSQMSQKLLIE